VSENPLLDILCSRDTVDEILAHLNPLDMLIAYLRTQGLSDAQIGDELGIRRQSVWERMQAARARIVAAMPELASTLDGRRHVGQERDGDGHPAHTVTQVARRLDVSRVTVLGWIHQGRLAGAYRAGRRWLIPSAGLSDFQQPSGRWGDDAASPHDPDG
jgi:excisionase family DNA binding protein